MSTTCRERKMNGGRRQPADFVTDSRTRTDFVNSSLLFRNDEVGKNLSHGDATQSAVVGKIREQMESALPPDMA